MAKEGPRGKYRKVHGKNMKRVMLSIPEGVLDMVDKAAEQDFTTRSDIIRTALLWYLRPQGRDYAQLDPEALLKTLQRRQAMFSMRQLIKELKKPESELSQ